MQFALGAVAVVVGLILAAVVLTLVLVPVFKGIGWLVSHVFAFIGGEIKDSLRLVGAIITAVIFSLLVVANVLIFRWSASAHFGRAFSAELSAGGASIYRILVGHPARLLGLKSLVDGIENRVPEAVAAAPTRDKPSRRTGQFEHYRIIGSLAGGGSGGKLYIAEPDDIKLAAFARNGSADVEQVVIKSFSLRDGSSLPQIVRESRALDAAKKLGLVLDHQLTPERFFYVMQYVPGESLGMVTQHLHAASPEQGLTDANFAKVFGYTEHLLATLSRYHEGGLWHKDVKPDNIIVHGSEAHLVDFGLITPLRSAMTLTTHGTEYFRDPEMVRMALKGVKVHEVDGAKFDVYAAGAVLYSVIENSFPAHGALSQISKRCPDAARWIIRRSMAEYDKRYPSARAMLADLQFLARAADPFAVKPAELPSFSGADVPEAPVVEVSEQEFDFVPPKPEVKPQPAAPIAGAAPAAAAAAVAAGKGSPKLRVTNWWSGKYDLDDAPPDAAHGGSKVFVAGIAGGMARPTVPGASARRGSPSVRRPAAEQLQSARARAEHRRASARSRMGKHRRDLRAGRRHASGANAGVVISVFLFLLFCGAVLGALLLDVEARQYVFNDGPGSKSSAIVGGVPVVTVETDPAPAPAPELPAMSGEVLVINDMGAGITAEANSYLELVFSTLGQTGLEVLGTFPWLGLDDEQSQRVVDLSGKAERLRAFTPLDSPELGPVMADWLGANETPDMLVWIWNGGDPEGPPRLLWFASPEIQAEMPEGTLVGLEQNLIPNS